MTDKSIDNYIENAADLTKPILIHLRGLIQSSCPDIEENIKWNAPSFEINGKLLCSLMAFKQHVNFLFTNGKDLQDPNNILEDVGAKSNMKGLKKICSVSDLPEDSVIIAFLKEASNLMK